MTHTTATSSPPPSKELTARQASATFDVPQRVLQYAAQRGLIPSRRVGNAYLLDSEACRSYAIAYQSRRRGPVAS